MDLPRDAANLGLQLEEKSIALDIQSGISESGSDILTAAERRSTVYFFFPPFFSRSATFFVPSFFSKMRKAIRKAILVAPSKLLR